MDCLSKDSPTLTRLPHLRSERKKVLVELSKLVASARAASGVGEADVSSASLPTDQELSALQNAARNVYAAVQRVMTMAVENGVQPTRDGNEKPNENEDEPTVKITPPSSRPVATPPPGNARIRDTFRSKTPSELTMSRPVSPSVGTSTSARSTSSNGDITPDSAGFPSHTLQESIDSTSSGGLGPAFEPGLPKPVDLDTIDGILDAIQRAEDTLYSTMAAFIGQIHSHSRGAHPTAHAGLIRMTKLSVDCIREMLTVIESLGRRSMDDDEGVDKLLEARDELYDLASRLVDCAEAVAEGGLAEPEEATSYDEDKESLIRISSEGMRLAAGCAGVVRWVVDPEEWEMPEKGGLYATPPNSVTPRAIPLVKREGKVGVRGQHTMSSLGRRVDGLVLAQGWTSGVGGLLGVPEQEGAGRERDQGWHDEEVVDEETVSFPVPVSFLYLDVAESRPVLRYCKPTLHLICEMLPLPLFVHPPTRRYLGRVRTHSLRLRRHRGCNIAVRLVRLIWTSLHSTILPSI